MSPGTALWSELKRRNVVRVALAYAVVAWFLIQAADIMLDNFGAPEWVFKTVTGLLALGFPLALFLSWAYELTPDGVKRTEDVPEPESVTPRTGKRIDRLILIGALAVIAVLVIERVWFAGRGPEADSVAAAATTTGESGQAAASIAVLPFVNMSADPEQEYFSDGLSEEILNLLAQIRELTVIGRTSSFAFKGMNVDLREIGETLGVAYLLEGSVRKAGDELRITAQLIRTDTGAHLWSQSYDRKLESVFAIQSEIAGAIADALRVSLVGGDDAAPVAQIAASIPAYERYLQARRLIQGRTGAGIEAARALLDEALTLDPDYAPAHAEAAKAVLLLRAGPSSYGDIPSDQAWASAQPLIDRALALDPNLAEAHAVQGLLFLQQRDFERAEPALVRALALNPSLSDALNWRANNLGAAGHLREQLAARRRLAELDPLNLANLAGLSGWLAASGEAEEGLAVAGRLQRGFPDSPLGFRQQALVLAVTGRLAEARDAAGRALALAPGEANVQSSVGAVFYALGDAERVLALPGADEHGPALLALGRVDEALATARARSAAAPDDYAAAYFLLYTLSLAGRHDEVLAVYRARWGDLAGLEAVFGADGGTQELIPIAAAQRALGQDETLAETLEHWGQRLTFMREQGYAISWFRAAEASHLALAGDRVAALAALTEAIDLGHRDPLLAIDPAFAALRDDPAFQAQAARNLDLINAERAKLDMAPLQ